MATVIKQTPDGWCISEGATSREWKNADEWQAGDALILNGDAEPSAEYAKASAIAIDFPAFNDGRGLSLAVLLRTRYAFDGELRAAGDVQEDIAHYMVRCGFDSLEISEDRDPQVALDTLFPYSANYQASATQPEPAWRRVNRGL